MTCTAGNENAGEVIAVESRAALEKERPTAQRYVAPSA
jgi:hypothetical protein